MPAIPSINLSKEDRQMVILSVLALLMAASAAYFFLFSPGWTKLAGVRAQAAELKEKAVHGREMMEDKPRILRIAKETSAKLDKLHAWIPEETDTSWILRLVSDVEKMEQIRTMAIKPLKDEEAAGQDVGFFKVATCQIELKTDYHSLGKFMDQLERKNPYILIKEISILSDPGDPLRHEVGFKIQYLKSKVAKKGMPVVPGTSVIPSAIPKQ